MHRNAERVQAFLDAQGATGRVRELDDSARTAAEAAAALGVEVDQIAKSLIFRVGEEPVLVITAGGNRVCTKKLKAHLGGKVRRADADLVRQATGFPIGGVPPVAHATDLRVILDEDLGRFESLWAAAGTPHAVFPTHLEELRRLTGGEVLAVKED